VRIAFRLASCITVKAALSATGSWCALAAS
jgi:hypothetical protein